MITHSRSLLVLTLLLLLLGLLLMPRSVSAQQLEYYGCFDHEKALGEPRASVSFFAFQPQNQRQQVCMNFCRTGVEVEGMSRVYKKGFTFPATYSGYRNNDGWCFCSRETTVQPLGLAEADCKYKIAVFQPAAARQPVTAPRPVQANQPPRAPTVNAGAWEPPFPLRYEGATQFTWAGNGDPDGDPVTYWIEAWWWNTPQGQWQQFIGEWVNEPYFTLTQARGLVPNVYYTWRVAACDTAKRSQPWYAWSGYSVFRTVQ